MLWFDYLNLVLLCICVGVFFVAKRKHRSLQYFFFYFLITLVVEIIGNILILRHQNNLFLYHILTPIQFFLIGGFFMEEIRLPNSRQLFRALFIFCVLMVAGAFFLNEYNSFYSLASISKNFAIILFSLYYFKHIFERLEIENLVHNRSFIIACILLVVAMGCFFIEGTMNYFINGSRTIALGLFYVRISLEFFFYLAFLTTIKFVPNK